MARINANILNLEERVIRTNKVQKTHKGGRTMSWSVLVVVGDGEGHAGVGLGKARGVPDAIRKSVEDAKKNIVKVPLVGTTIPHAVLGRAGASLVLLKPAAPGTGVVAGGSVRAILEVAGVKDVLAKSLGAPNAINTAQATIKCLTQLKDAETVAALRGKTVEELLPKGVLAAMAAAAQPEPEVEEEKPAAVPEAEEKSASAEAESEATGEVQAEGVEETSAAEEEKSTDAEVETEAPAAAAEEDQPASATAEEAANVEEDKAAGAATEISAEAAEGEEAEPTPEGKESA